ncbi:hypothetical protein PENSPDRAFT_681178 [Peniophora sp. CONT]|nr:hypothetical protein PENSPDRAFT_681178 [Peniophora sp. CONT]
MGKTYDHIPEDMIEWGASQKAFWVATAPLDGEGHVNVSPKGVEGTFHFVDKNRVWYEDLTGSGAETVSHLRENGRITILFQAFDGGPRILRLFGKGHVHEFGTPEYEQLLPPGKRQPGSRAVIVVDVHRVGTSCGWGVPFYQYVGPRDTLVNFGVKMEKDDGEPLKKYWNKTNVRSVDGLPSLQTAIATEAVPNAAIKEVKGGLPIHRTKTLSAQKGVATIPLLLAFAAGLLVAIVSVRFSAVAREMVV